jgi:hypothetical protein
VTRDDERLRGAFADLLADAPAHGDPAPAVQRRISRAQRRRTTVAAVTASVFVIAAGATVYGVTRPASHHPRETTTEVVSVNPRLSLRVDVAASVTVGVDEQVTVVLSGAGEAAELYGWRVGWGDGGLDRVFGSADCRTGSPKKLDVTRVFTHRYLRAGRTRIIVELTRCGVVEARAVTHITVTQEP